MREPSEIGGQSDLYPSVGAATCFVLQFLSEGAGMSHLKDRSTNADPGRRPESMKGECWNASALLEYFRLHEVPRAQVDTLHQRTVV